jgi:hypothetical protein
MKCFGWNDLMNIWPSTQLPLQLNWVCMDCLVEMFKWMSQNVCFFLLKATPYTMVGFDLTTHCSVGRDNTTRPRRLGDATKCLTFYVPTYVHKYICSCHNSLYIHRWIESFSLTQIFWWLCATLSITAFNRKRLNLNIK